MSQSLFYNKTVGYSYQVKKLTMLSLKQRLQNDFIKFSDFLLIFFSTSSNQNSDLQKRSSGGVLQKDVFKNFKEFTEKTCTGVSFLVNAFGISPVNEVRYNLNLRIM